MGDWFRKKQEKDKEKVKNMDHSALITGSANEYNESKFWDKLKSASKKMGSKLVYYSLLLFYAIQDPEVPTKSKLTIAGALGYLILPVDLIPDMIPVVGFTDDLAIIVFAVYQISSHISEETKVKAYTKVKDWFGEDPDNIDKEFMPVG
ncbi:MAG: YkvA family protein [Candidatus Bathyarchaeota archaeon]|nr:YkvA family protein [Candidatus Bathyarchaeota archaeon]